MKKTKQVGIVTQGAAVVLILAFVALVLMFTVDMRFGPVNDLLVALQMFLMAPLAFLVYGWQFKQHPILSTLLLLLGIAGINLVIVSHVDLVFGPGDFEQTLPGVLWGFFLHSLWIIFANIYLMNENRVPREIAWWGIGGASGYVVGIAIYFLITPEHPLLAWPVVVGMLIGFVGSLVWLFKIGRFLRLEE